MEKYTKKDTCDETENSPFGGLTGFSPCGNVIYPEMIDAFMRVIRDRPIFIRWTDVAGSQYDLLFSYFPAAWGSSPDGDDIFLAIDVFVSIMGIGAFGFKRKDKPNYSPKYVGEKLNLGAVDNVTTQKLAALINAIIKRF